jgi:hypothetical protein
MQRYSYLFGKRKPSYQIMTAEAEGQRAGTGDWRLGTGGQGLGTGRIIAPLFSGELVEVSVDAFPELMLARSTFGVVLHSSS